MVALAPMLAPSLTSVLLYPAAPLGCLALGVKSLVYRRSRLSGDLGVSAGNVESMGLKCRERRKKGLPAPTLQVSTINTEEYMPRQKEFIERWLPYVDVVRLSR